MTCTNFSNIDFYFMKKKNQIGKICGKTTQPFSREPWMSPV